MSVETTIDNQAYNILDNFNLNNHSIENNLKNVIK